MSTELYNSFLSLRITHQLYCTPLKALVLLPHCRCLEGYMMDTDIDTFTCQKDGHWFPERISCSPKKCPLPANLTHIIVHGDDFSVNKQVSVSCAEGYTYEGVNISTCQVRCLVLIRTCRCNSFMYITLCVCACGYICKCMLYRICECLWVNI